jgi:uncharacterized protein with GYD domain
MRLPGVQQGEIFPDMATFILLSTLTDDGAQTLMNEPERIHEVNAELARMGVRVVSQFAVLGMYDFVNIVEAPDNVTIARVSAELASRGSVRITTLVAIPIDEYVAGLQAGR